MPLTQSQIIERFDELCENYTLGRYNGNAPSFDCVLAAKIIYDIVTAPTAIKNTDDKGIEFIKNYTHRNFALKIGLAKEQVQAPKQFALSMLISPDMTITIAEQPAERKRSWIL